MHGVDRIAGLGDGCVENRPVHKTKGTLLTRYSGGQAGFSTASSNETLFLRKTYKVTDIFPVQNAIIGSRQ